MKKSAKVAKAAKVVSNKRCNKTLDWVEAVTGVKYKKVKTSY